MKRYLLKNLVDWKKNDRRKPLIIRGARQVGKSFLIREFGEAHFSDLITIDFERNPEYKKIFSHGHDPKKIISGLEVLSNKKITPGKTLLFLDELQECPEAIISFRYLYEELPALHVIGAGSLLEFALQSISFPVGRIQFMYLYPMSFAEFLAAAGNANAEKTILQKPRALEDPVHDYLMKMLQTYFYIGGMPESVKTYIETGNLKNSVDVLAGICSTYRLDFSKYSPHVDKHCLENVLVSCARSVGTQTKYSGLSDGFTNPTIKKAYHTLALAGVIHPVYSVNPPEVPLEAVKSDKRFKTVMIDIGIMNYLCGLPMQYEFLQEDLTAVYRGAMAEQFVGQELILKRHKAFYWGRETKSSSAEVDYVFTEGNKVFPVEVKSSSQGRLRSLHMYMDSYKPKKGFVISSRPFDTMKEQKLDFVPLYFTGSLINE